MREADMLVGACMPACHLQLPLFVDLALLIAGFLFSLLRSLAMSKHAYHICVENVKHKTQHHSSID